jgi:hypothetical protein
VPPNSRTAASKTPRKTLHPHEHTTVHRAADTTRDNVACKTHTKTKKNTRLASKRTVQNASAFGVCHITGTSTHQFDKTRERLQTTANTVRAQHKCQSRRVRTSTEHCTASGLVSEKNANTKFADSCKQEDCSKFSKIFRVFGRPHFWGTLARFQTGAANIKSPI